MAEEASAKKHDWSQSDSEVTINFPVDASTQKDKLKVKFGVGELKVQVGGSVLIDAELSGKVVPDDCYWALEGSGDKRQLVVSLGKKKSGSWRVLTKDEEESLPVKSSLDDDFDVMNLEHDDDDPERVEEQERNEKMLEARYAKLKSEKGLQHEDTLQTFFALFDNCIQLYRLNKLSDYLEDIVPACRKRDDKYKLKAVQALAFVRWKQSKFKEALPLLLEMEEILGKGAALCENIAHTYNSLGDYEKAEDYFRQALKFIEQESGPNRGNRGGVLLGLGLVRDRLGKQKEALPVCVKAYEFYKERANGAPASLQAKAAISCAKINAKLGNLQKAEAFIVEAVAMYEVTCGATSPLTASAYMELGKCYWAQRKRADAQKALKRAYEIEAMKDAWDLVSLLEIHNLLMDTHLKETQNIEREKFTEYFKTAEYVVHRVKRELPQDGNAAVYYKAAAEMKAWGGSYIEAKELFELAIPLLRNEKSTDCSGLIQTCNDMLAFCDRNLQGTQHSPMAFEIPAGKAVDDEDANRESGQAEGVKIEELPDDDMDAAEAADFEDAVEFTESCRSTIPADFAELVRLAKQVSCEPLLPDQKSFSSYVEGPGAGLCQTIMRSSSTATRGKDHEVVAVALCSSDGVFGHLTQLVSAQDSHAKTLLEACTEKCRERNLRTLFTHVSSESCQKADFYNGLSGWSCSQKVYSFSVKGGQGKSGASGYSAAAPAQMEGVTSAAASSSTAPKEPKLRRDDYDAWNKLNVEKTLVQEDGMSPDIVPAAKQAVDDFGVGVLDISSKLTTFAWDQSSNFVSIYVTFDGASALAEEASKVIFRPTGVLLMVDEPSGKRRWFKVPNLCKEIDMEASLKKAKADTFVLKLKKRATGTTWSDLTDDKDKHQERREYRINHGDLKGATTEELLADMYQSATDEERTGLRDAMRVNREKRAQDAEKK